MKLKAYLAYDLKGLVASLNKEKDSKFPLGTFGGDAFKAITLKRKLVSYLKDNNRDYEADVQKLSDLITATQKDMQEHNGEVDAVSDTTKDEKEAAKQAYNSEADKKLVVSLKESFGEVLVFTRKGPDGNPSSILSIRGKTGDVELDLTFDENQMKFLKEKIAAFGGELFNSEDDFVAVAEAFGLES